MLGQRHLPGCSPRRPDELLTAPGCAAAAPRKLRGAQRGEKGWKTKGRKPKGARAWICRDGNARGAGSHCRLDALFNCVNVFANQTQGCAGALWSSCPSFPALLCMCGRGRVADPRGNAQQRSETRQGLPADQTEHKPIALRSQPSLLQNKMKQKSTLIQRKGQGAHQIKRQIRLN